MFIIHVWLIDAQWWYKAACNGDGVRRRCRRETLTGLKADDNDLHLLIRASCCMEAHPVVFREMKSQQF